MVLPRLLAAMALLAGFACAQDPRGSMTGIVTDPQGARIPDAAVTVTNTETNVSHRIRSNEAGAFEVQLLNPGNYSVSVEAPGFKRSLYRNLELSVAGRVEIVCPLEVGQVAESVEVTADAPLIETASASGGRVVTSRELLQLPFNDMNPLRLSALGAGMQWTGNPGFLRPFDNGGMSSFNTMGNAGSNMYTLDGIPVNGYNRQAGFSPPADSVSEFKLETTPYDVAYGNSAGASINISSKSGTRAFHGSLFNQHWQQRWNAMSHFTRLAYEQNVAAGRVSPDAPRQQPGRSNNFGGSVGGPVAIPKVQLKDKLFFFLSYNGIYQRATETSTVTVPKPAWNQGDFSDLLAVDAVRYTIYDPRSARREGSRVVRMPFAGNRGIPVLSPMFPAYSKIYPSPNNIAGLVTPEGRNNYFPDGVRTIEDFNSIINRFDYNISNSHRVFARWYRNQRWNGNGDWTYSTVPGLQAGGGVRNNKGVGATWTWTVSSSTVLDLSAGWNLYKHGNRRPAQTQFKPTDVGLPAYMDAFAGNYQQLPALVFSDLNSISQEYPGVMSVANAATGDLKLGMFTVKGNHSLKYGWVERRYWFGADVPGFTAGQFGFDNRFVKSADNDTTAANLGLEWASFMMALPYSVRVDRNDTAYWSTRYRSFYFQDNWRVTPKLNLTLGVRYEREGGITERFNRGIAGQFVFDDTLPFSGLVEAAYARSPLTELAASQFKVRGGIRYLGDPDKTYTNGTHALLPRVGVAYSVNKRTVLRAGYGSYMDTFNVNNTRPSQDGFSQPTNTVVSSDLGLTFCCGVGAAAGLSSGANPVANPFPVRADGSRFDSPYRTSRGIAAFAGRGYNNMPADFRPNLQHRWSIGVQRQVSQDVALKASYNGSYAHLWVAAPVNYLDGRYWAAGNTRNNAVDTDLNTNVANPFAIANLAPLQQSDPALYTYLATQSFFTSGTIRKNQLLRLFPGQAGFSGLRPGASFSNSLGGSRYHDFQFEAEKRFSKGLQTALTYTYSTSETQDVYLNEFDASPSWQPNSSIRPNRLVWSSIYEVPFGKGRRWLKSGPAGYVVGGWQLSWIYQYQDGPLLSWGNRFFYGDLDKLGEIMNHDKVNSQNIHLWLDPAIAYRGTGAIPSGFTGFEGRSANQPGAFHVRVFPTRIDGLRSDGIRMWDVKVLRQFPIRESLKASFSVDLLNATNHTNFNAPNTDPSSTNFGAITGQNGASRIIQFNLRLDF